MDHGKIATQLRELFPQSPDLTSQGVAYKHCVPLFDKNAGFLSSFASILRKCFLCTLHSRLERVCELVLPTMWLTTPVQIYAILHEWYIKKKFPKTNWSTALMSEMVTKYGGFSSGTGQRYQPSLNFSISESELTDGLRILRRTIQELMEQKRNSCTHELQQMHEIAISNLKTIIGVGDLGAQHGLSILVLSGIIPHTGLSKIAHVAKGTNTLKSLKNYFSIGEATANKMYSELSQELNVGTDVIENVVCEYFRDVPDPETELSDDTLQESIRARGTYRPDTFFCDQLIIYIGDDGVRYAIGVGDKDVYPLSDITLETPVSKEVNWHSHNFVPSQSLMIKVSVNSRHRSEVQRNPKVKTVLSPKTVQHTGVGQILGCEEALLMRCEKRRRRICGMEPDDEEEHSPEMGFRANLSRREELHLALSSPRRVTRNAKTVDVLSIFSATREEGTYVFIDVRSTICTILDGEASHHQKKKRRKTKSYFQTHREYLEAVGRYGFTAEIKCRKHVILSTQQDKSIVIARQFLGFMNGRAYFQTEKAALLSAYLTALVLFGMSSDLSEDGDPLWAAKKLPSNRQYTPDKEFCVLYQNGGASSNDSLFGILFFRGGHRVLSVPSNDTDLTEPWEDFCFVKFGKKCKNDTP